MEHLYFKFLQSIIDRLDGKTQKTLRQLLPNSEALWRDPAAFLDTSPLIIGPARRYGTRVIMWLVLVAPICAGLLIFTGIDVILLAMCGSAILVLLWILFWHQRGGYCVLSRDNAAFLYHGKKVCCPWALFNVVGQPFVTGKWENLLLPVQAAAVPLARRVRGPDDEGVTSGWQLKLPHFRFQNGNQVVLKLVYELDAGELGYLLLHLGCTLGRELPEAAPEAVQQTDAACLPTPPNLSHNGWLTLGLTRLSFPAYCCDCGNYCIDFQEFENAGGGEKIKLAIPLCGSCQSRHRKRTRRGAVVGAGTACLLAMAFALAFSALLPRRELTILSVPFALIMALIGAAIGRDVAKSRLVRIRYYPRNGTLAIRFPNPRYAEAILASQEDEERRAPKS